LAGQVRAWQQQSQFAKGTDFVFPSMRTEGRRPLCSCLFVTGYLRPAAKKAGVQIEDGQRFGLHNLRHSLSNWLVNKAKIEPKTMQGILRHSKIQTTLDLYTQGDSGETRAAQGEFLTAVGPQWFELNPPNCFRRNGGDDETRTRDLCRDSENVDRN
jgi:integrase